MAKKRKSKKVRSRKHRLSGPLNEATSGAYGDCGDAYSGDKKEACQFGVRAMGTQYVRARKSAGRAIAPLLDGSRKRRK